MKERKSTQLLKSFLFKNWYKLFFIGFGLYIFLQKDMSFQINLSSPLKMEEVEEKSSPSPKTAKKSQEKYTDNRVAVPAHVPSSHIIDKLEMSFLPDARNKSDNYSVLQQIEETTKLAYLERFKQVAISERKKYGIPSSIILANALLHSHAGQNIVARSGNNQFGLFCTVEWRGESENYDGLCYRHYSNAWNSFRDHSLHVTTENFEPLRQLGTTNYKAWAKGLEKAGFSKEANLASKLIQLIEGYQLFKLDSL